ncbi:MAG: hypothetical protein RDU89_08055 [bacterium]|nr:hypothetical protein [bacterium]
MSVRKYRYMQVVQTVGREGKTTPGQEHLWAIGRYDERVLAEARRLLRELVGPGVIAELEEASGSPREKATDRRSTR